MKKTEIEKPVSKREQVFLNEYMIDLNAKRAAIAAGFAETTAHVYAGQWVSDGPMNNKPHLTAAINKRLAERAEQTGITIDRIEQELASIAFVGLPNKTISPRDKLTALELLGKRRGMFKENLEISGGPLVATGIAIYIPSNGREHDKQ